MTQPSPAASRSGSSLLHGMDAAVKLICFVLLCAAVLFTRTAAGYVAMLVFSLALSYLACLQPSQALAGVRRVRWMLAAILLLNFLFAFPDRAFFRWWMLCPSTEGLAHGIEIVIRLMLILVFSAVLSATTSSLRLNEGLRTILQPLGRLGLPASHIAAMLAVTMRFIPLLFEEADNIVRAQRLRGMRFEKQGFFDTARASAPVAVPLCVSAFKRAGSLALALEAKGYRMDGRGVVLEKLMPSHCDWYALFVSAAVLALQIIIL